MSGIPGAAVVSRASEFQARAVCEFRHGAVARRLQLGRVRKPRHGDRAAARLCDHPGLALAAEQAALRRDEHRAIGLHAARAGAGARTAGAGARHRQRAERARRIARTIAAGTDHGRLRRRRCHRLCNPLSGGADRIHQGRVRADSARLRRQRARRRRRPDHDDAADPSAAAAARDARRRHRGVRGLP